MIVHAVYFWLKPSLTPAQIQTFVKEVNTLKRIPSAVHCWIGEPGPTDRPVVDRTYSYGLVVVFNDMAGHDAYQVDPIHTGFVSTCKSLWSQVKIYDSEG